MTPEKTVPAWTAADAENTRRFLDSPTGVRFIRMLSYHRPDYRAFTNIEERAVQSGILEGYEKCILEIQNARESK